MPKTPSPCIDVCKYKRAGHCIGCAMTKPQKALFKRAKTSNQRAGFVAMLIAQQDQLGGYAGWRAVYARKCRKKGVNPPFPTSN